MKIFGNHEGIKMQAGIAGVILSLLLLWFPPVSAKISSGNLSGFIIDSETSEPVTNAAIMILNSNKYSISAEDGSFRFNDLDAGTYQIKITHVSYQEKLINVDFNSEQNKNIIIYMMPRAINLSPVIVSGETKPGLFDQLNDMANVIKGKELQRDLSLTLASTLKNETGLAIRSMGPAPARPVIRGLGQNRVLISEDGTTTSDLSSTSPDHAVSIEPFTIEQIQVIRGPRVLLQTPTTIGGVVNVVRKEIPDEVHNQIHAIVGGYAESANQGILGSAKLEIPFNPFAAKLEFSKRKAGDLQTPVGKLGNSYSENTNYSLGTAFFEKWGSIGISYRNFELDYGIPGGFVGAHPNGVDINLYRRQFNFKSVLDSEAELLNNLELNYSYVIYRHKEFENSGRIGSEFRVQTHLGSLNFTHNGFSFLESGIAGISMEYREYEIGGFVFTSPATSINISSYIFETFSLERIHFEAGARFNFDEVSPERENPISKIGNIRKRNFRTYSLAFSLLYEVSDIVFTGFNISRSSRVPTIEELFSEGPHLAAYSYETGNPDLKAETGTGAEIFIYHKFETLYFNINLFYNNLDSYIIPRNTGELNYATFLPIYSTTGLGAIFYGAENRVDWKLSRNFALSSSISFTRGRIKSGGSLPQIPPLKAHLELRYGGENWLIGAEIELAARQSEVDLNEEPTAGYMILNKFFQTNFEAGGVIHALVFSIDNIFNKEYRNHLSRVKSILPEAGRNFRLSYRIFI